MSRSRKKDVFSKVVAVKSNARDRIGTPKPSFVITPKSEKPSRYKPSLRDLLQDDYENENKDE